MCAVTAYVPADVVALTGCVRSSLGICASNSGAIAGCLLWKVSKTMQWLAISVAMATGRRSGAI